MREKITYNDRKIIISGYNGKTERDLIMYRFSRDNENPPNLEDLLFLLENYISPNIPLESLEEDEIFNILYSLRGLSISDTLDLHFDCPDCNSKFKVTIEISKILEKGKDFTCKYLKNTYSSKIEDYIIDIDKLSLKQFDILEKYIYKHKTRFNLTREIKCIDCNTIHYLNLKDLNILTQSFSNFDIQGFYTSLNSLVYYGKYDIASLLKDVLPFERELLTTLVQTEIDKINELKNKTNGIKSIQT